MGLKSGDHNPYKKGQVKTHEQEEGRATLVRLVCPQAEEGLGFLGATRKSEHKVWSAKM